MNTEDKKHTGGIWYQEECNECGAWFIEDLNTTECPACGACRLIDDRSVHWVH